MCLLFFQVLCFNCFMSSEWMVLTWPASQSLIFCSLQSVSSVTQSCLTLCNAMDCSMSGFPIHHQHPEPAQTHVHRVGDAIKTSHPLSSPSPLVGGNRQNRLYLESRTPSWVGLWTLSYVPSIYGNNIPTGKPIDGKPLMEEPQGSYLESPPPKRIP